MGLLGQGDPLGLACVGLSESLSIDLQDPLPLDGHEVCAPTCPLTAPPPPSSPPVEAPRRMSWLQQWDILAQHSVGGG
jgi:hypothetical protein